jgi:hypothetical protein
MSMMAPVLNPVRLFAVRALASLGQPVETRAGMSTFRTALRTTLAAAGVDTDNIVSQPSVSFTGTKHHALIVWYDVPCDALRLFAPPLRLIDETSARALDLLNGSVTTDLDLAPIEDVDAAARLMALMSVGGDDPADLHARFIEPQLHRYDEDFTPPSVTDLGELWRRIFPYYFGGTSTPPTALDAWIARAWAFGVGHVERPLPVKTSARAPRKSRVVRSRGR